MKLITPADVKTDDIKPPRVNNRNYYIRVIDKKSKDRMCVVSLPTDNMRRHTCMVIRMKFEFDVSLQVSYAKDFTTQEKYNTFHCVSDYEVIQIIKRVFDLPKKHEQTTLLQDNRNTLKQIERIVGNINRIINKVKS